jgi:hypothetical protein
VDAQLDRLLTACLDTFAPGFPTADNGNADGLGTL